MPGKRKNVNEVSQKDKSEKDKSEWKVESVIDEVVQAIVGESTNKDVCETTINDKTTESDNIMTQSMYVSEVSDQASDVAKKEDISEESSEGETEESSEEVSDEESSREESSEGEEEEEEEEVEIENDSDESSHKYVYIVERRNNDNGLPGIISCTATLLISLWVIRGLLLISSLINDNMCCICN